MAWSSFCVEAFKITMVSRLPPWPRNRRVGFSTADLDFNNCGMSHWFVGILYSSRLILLYSNHLEGRQTVENHLVHIGTNSYRRTHVMTSSISILVHFFVVFIFAEAGLSTKIAKICTQRKFPTIRYVWIRFRCYWTRLDIPGLSQLSVLPFFIPWTHAAWKGYLCEDPVHGNYFDEFILPPWAHPQRDWDSTQHSGHWICTCMCLLFSVDVCWWR